MYCLLGAGEWIVLFTKAALKDIETTLAILRRNEFRCRELGAYTVIGGRACPRLGGRYDSPEGPPEELLPGEKAGGPQASLTSRALCHCRSPAFRKLPLRQ